MQFSWRKALRFFRLNKWKRWSLLAFAFISAILVIALGTSLYSSQNVRKSIAYGGGTEYLIKVQSNNANANVTQIANEIYQRIDRLGVVGAIVTPETHNNEKFVRVTYPRLSSPSEIARIETEITAKPSLAFTDIWGNPLFTPSGNFDNYRLTNTTSKAQRELDTIDWATESKVPLAANGVSGVYQSSGYKLRVRFELSQLSQWTAATSYLMSLPEASRKLLVWVNMGEYISKLKNTPGVASGSTLWSESGQDPFKAAHVNNDLKAPLRVGQNYLLSNVDQYLVTSVDIKQAQNSLFYTFDSNFSAEQTINWSRQLNFATADYELTTFSTTSLSPPSSVDGFLVGLVIVAVFFALASILLLVNYGLLGVIATVGLAFFAAVTLALFTAMRGEYAPESLAAFVLGFALALDGCMTFFDRLKGEASLSGNFAKAHTTARRNLWQLLDGNVLFFIAGACLFYFGSQNAVGVSVVIMLSSALSLIVATGLIRLVSYWLVGLTKVTDRAYLFGLSSKVLAKSKTLASRINFNKSGLVFTGITWLVALAGLLMLIATSVISKSINGAFALSAFSDQATYQFNVTPDGATTLEAARKLLIDAGFQEQQIVYGTLDNVINSVRVTTSNTSLIASLDPTTLFSVWGENYSYSVAAPTLSIQVVTNSLIAFGVIAAIAFVYIVVRMRWTYALAILFSLLGEALFLTGILVFARLNISTTFVSVAFAGMTYSLYDKVVVLSRVNESINSHTSKFDAESLKRLTNEGLSSAFYRSVFLGSFLSLLFVSLSAFSAPIKLDQGIALIVLTLNGSLATLFVAPVFLLRLEIWRHQGIAYRETKEFWKSSKVEEQTIQGINDFRY